MQNMRKVILLCIGLTVLATLSISVFAQGGGGGRILPGWAVTERFYDTSSGDRVAAGLLVTDRYFINSARFVSPGNRIVKINGALEIPHVILLEKPFIFEPLPGQSTTFTTILKDGVWYKANQPSGNPPSLQIPVWDSINKVWKIGNPPPQGAMPPSNPPQGYTYMWDGSQYVLVSMQDMSSARPLQNYDVPFWNGLQWTVVKSAPMWMWGWDGSKYYQVVPAPWPMPTTMPEPGKMWVWFGNAYTQISVATNPPPNLMQTYDIGKRQWVFVQPPSGMELPQLEPAYGRIDKAVVLLTSPPTKTSGMFCSSTYSAPKALIIPHDMSAYSVAAQRWQEFMQAWAADTDAKVNSMQQNCQTQYNACLSYRDRATCDQELTACNAQATQTREQFNADVSEYNSLFSRWYQGCAMYSTPFGDELLC